MTGTNNCVCSKQMLGDIFKVIIGIIIAIIIGDVLISIIAGIFGGEDQKSKGKDDINSSISRGVDGHRINLNSAEQDILNNDVLAAIKYHDKEKAESLISQGANVNASDVPGFPGYTPLLYAIDGDDIEMVQFLLRHGANAHQQTYIGGIYITAFKYSRGLGKQNMADLLQYS